MRQSRVLISHLGRRNRFKSTLSSIEVAGKHDPHDVLAGVKDSVIQLNAKRRKRLIKEDYEGLIPYGQILR